MSALTDVQVSKWRRRGLRFFFILHIVCNDFTQFIISVKLADSVYLDHKISSDLSGVLEAPLSIYLLSQNNIAWDFSWQL